MIRNRQAGFERLCFMGARIGTARVALFAMTFLLCSSFTLGGCKKEDPIVEPERWTPEKVYPGLADEAPKGFLDLRGIIHAHSVYSHDACDNAPRDPVSDAIDESCVEDLRRGICQTAHDYIMFTDHGDSFARTPFQETLIYRPEQGDTLLMRAGSPVANTIACEGGHKTLIMAGTETGSMPVGLEAHVEGNEDEKRRVYGSLAPADLALMRDKGAVLLVAHTEDWSDQELEDLPLDGFEMFNIHANLFLNFGRALKLIEQLARPEELPHSDLILLTLISEDPVYLGRWGRVLASGAHRVTTMATDVHRNTFRDLLPDGERIDSYRRMMKFFSNHLLVKADSQGGFDDRSLKEALRAGRLYGVFEYLGYPKGFDYHGEAGGQREEMGASLSLAGTPTLITKLPSLRNLDPKVRPPELTIRILRASADGKDPEGWVVEASGSTDMSFKPTLPGAYRAEVRMRPLHLLGQLGDYDYLAEDESFVWIYSNPIYIEN